VADRTSFFSTTGENEGGGRARKKGRGEVRRGTAGFFPSDRRGRRKGGKKKLMTVDELETGRKKKKRWGKGGEKNGGLPFVSYFLRFEWKGKLEKKKGGKREGN